MVLGPAVAAVGQPRGAGGTGPRPRYAHRLEDATLPAHGRTEAEARPSDSLGPGGADPEGAARLRKLQIALSFSHSSASDQTLWDTPYGVPRKRFRGSGTVGGVTVDREGRRPFERPNQGVPSQGRPCQRKDDLAMVPWRTGTGSARPAKSLTSPPGRTPRKARGSRGSRDTRRA